MLEEAESIRRAEMADALRTISAATAVRLRDPEADLMPIARQLLKACVAVVEELEHFKIK